MYKKPEMYLEEFETKAKVMGDVIMDESGWEDIDLPIE